MSVMSHGSKNNPTDQIDKIRGMIREFIRLEVVPYELTNQEKMSFILDNESSGGGGLADIASSLGFGSMAGNSSMFSGENFKELLKRQY